MFHNNPSCREFKSHAAVLNIIRSPSCWSFLLFCIREKCSNSQLCLLYVVTSAACNWLSITIRVRHLKIEKRPSTGVQRCCRLLMMYEMRRSVHQRGGRLLLHPETPLSLSVTREDPSPTLHPHLYMSQWLSSDTFYHARFHY